MDKSVVGRDKNSRHIYTKSVVRRPYEVIREFSFKTPKAISGKSEVPF